MIRVRLPVALAAMLAAILPAAARAQDDTLPARPEITAMACAPASPVPKGKPARLSVTAIHPAGSPLEYSWDADDGSPRTDWSRADSVLMVTYAQPGLYSVRVRVRDTARMESVRILRLQVSDGPAGALPRSSPIALDPRGRKLWVANPDHNSVSLIDPDALALVREAPACLQPTSLALDGQGNVWVTCRGSDEIRVLSPDGLRTERTIPLDYGSGPVAVVFDPGGATAYVALEGAGRILRLDAATRAATGTVPVGPFPRALAISPGGGRLLVARFISDGRAGTVWSIDLPGFLRATPIALPLDSTTLESGTAARGLPNYVSGLAIHPDGKTAWYAAKKDNILQGLARDGNPLTFETSMRALVSELDLATGGERVSRRLDLDNASQPSALAFAPHGNILFAALQGNDKLYALDAKNREVLAIQATGAAPQGIAVDADGGKVFVQDFLGRTVSVYAAGDMLSRGADTLARIAVIPVSAREPLAPAVLAGKRLFYGAGDARMGQDGYASCAACHLDGGHDGRVWDFTDRGEGLRNTTTLLGKAGMGQGPLHWSANFDEMQDFEHDMRGPFGGKGFLPDAVFAGGDRDRPLGASKAGLSPDLDALAAYVASLATARRSPYRNPDGTLTAQAREGEAVFRGAKAGCAACHSGTAYTDSRLPGPAKPAAGPVAIFPGAQSLYTQEGFLLHDVGTLGPASGKRLSVELKGLDTPTLVGLWETAPYLHDGSAVTLMEVLTRFNKDDRHGATSGLSDREKEALAAFLLQLDVSDGAPGRLAGPGAGAAGSRADLTAIRSPGGRLLGLRLGGAWQGPLPRLGVYTPQGRRLAAIPSRAWRASGAGEAAGWFLPWTAAGLEAIGSDAGLLLIRSEGRPSFPAVKILLARP